MKTTLDRLIELAIEEDVGPGDITTEAIVPKDLEGVGTISTKEDIVVAGLKVAEKVFARVDLSLAWGPKCEDGDKVEADTIIAEVSGKVTSMLKAERIALNFLQHLSGVASFTALFAHEVKGTKTRILDTRKTHPGLRELEKEAVRFGEGFNHRMGLFDRYLIKNNHISAAGSVTEAVKRVKANRKQGVLIEVETSDLTEVERALEAEVDVIMLDNFSPHEVLDAVKLVRGKVKLEVSGGVTLENVKSYARTGVDFVSIGALTHSAPAADIHMLIS